MVLSFPMMSHMRRHDDNNVPLQQLTLVNEGWSSSTDLFKNKYLPVLRTQSVLLHEHVKNSLASIETTYID